MTDVVNSGCADGAADSSGVPNVLADNDADVSVVALGLGNVARRQWTLKGLAPETVEQTREAARRNGVRLNEWVTQALFSAIEGSMPDHVEDADSPSDLKARLDAFETYVKEEFAAIRKRDKDIEAFMNSISAFMVRIYAESPKRE